MAPPARPHHPSRVDDALNSRTAWAWTFDGVPHRHVPRSTVHRPPGELLAVVPCGRHDVPRALSAPTAHVQDLGRPLIPLGLILCPVRRATRRRGVAHHDRASSLTVSDSSAAPTATTSTTGAGGCGITTGAGVGTPGPPPQRPRCKKTRVLRDYTQPSWTGMWVLFISPLSSLLAIALG
jgi:hypothetical protein